MNQMLQFNLVLIIIIIPIASALLLYLKYTHTNKVL